MLQVAGDPSNGWSRNWRNLSAWRGGLSPKDSPNSAAKDEAIAVTDEKIAQGILKFVWQMNGKETGERAKRVAISKNWLDEDGAPTADGRQLFQSFELLRSIERDLM